MSKRTLPEYVHFLLSPTSYPHPVDRVQLVQTHISFIILAGDFVYKWKKPVDFGFLDFSTLPKRKFYCEEELRLNRRLCPEIYLDTVQLRTTVEGFSLLGGSGEVVEYGVKMARMPEERMMERVIQRGELSQAHLGAIVDTLVPFYRHAAHGERIVKHGGIEAIRQTVCANFNQTERFVGTESLSEPQFLRIKTYAASVLGRKSLFERRVEKGWVRECHGDLHSGNICLSDRVLIFDCIEFSESLRCTDIAADVSFLAMDLDFHNLFDLSDFFVDCFVAASGDDELSEVLDFYKCYRAYVRGKICLLTAEDSGVDGETARRSRENARHYFLLAESYTHPRHANVHQNKATARR